MSAKLVWESEESAQIRGDANAMSRDTKSGGGYRGESHTHAFYRRRASVSDCIVILCIDKRLSVFHVCFHGPLFCFTTAMVGCSEVGVGTER